MAYTPITYIDLFGTEAEAVTVFKSFYPDTTLTDDQIKKLIKISFDKIEPILKQFRNYLIEEDTRRNYDVKKAIVYESESLNKANLGADNITVGNINTTIEQNTSIIEEKMGNITTKYSASNSGGLNSASKRIRATFNLLSVEASIILSGYIQKTFGMGVS